VVDVAVHVPQQELRVEVLVAELADPADTPGTERLDHRRQLKAGRGQDVSHALSAVLPVHDAGAHKLDAGLAVIPVVMLTTLLGPGGHPAQLSTIEADELGSGWSKRRTRHQPGRTQHAGFAWRPEDGRPGRRRVGPGPGRDNRSRRLKPPGVSAAGAVTGGGVAVEAAGGPPRGRPP
jgi:hypothetical protein